jgi:hypothetical protein
MTGLPGPFDALARQVAGEIADVTDCSWQRDSSAVWRNRQVPDQAIRDLVRLEHGPWGSRRAACSSLTGRSSSRARIPAGITGRARR